MPGCSGSRRICWTAPSEVDFIDEMNRLLLSLAATGWFAPLLFAANFPEPYDTEKAGDAPMPAAEAATTAVLPEGFRLEVFASEPEVRQPIGITFDEKGRLWVAECYTFAENPRRWDLELNDRVTILEDTDATGSLTNAPSSGIRANASPPSRSVTAASG